MAAAKENPMREYLVFDPNSNEAQVYYEKDSDDAANKHVENCDTEADNDLYVFEMSDAVGYEVGKKAVRKK